MFAIPLSSPAPVHIPVGLWCHSCLHSCVAAARRAERASRFFPGDVTIEAAHAAIEQQQYGLASEDGGGRDESGSAGLPYPQLTNN
jgi:hypothetical protein